MYSLVLWKRSSESEGKMKETRQDKNFFKSDDETKTFQGVCQHHWRNFYSKKKKAISSLINLVKRFVIWWNKSEIFGGTFPKKCLLDQNTTPNQSSAIPNMIRTASGSLYETRVFIVVDEIMNSSKYFVLKPVAGLSMFGIKHVYKGVRTVLDPLDTRWTGSSWHQAPGSQVSPEHCIL